MNTGDGRFSTKANGYSPVSLSGFDRSPAADVGHWRGFTKFTQPDGFLVAICSHTDDTGLVLGPCLPDGRDVDQRIRDFYRDDQP